MAADNSASPSLEGLRIARDPAAEGGGRRGVWIVLAALAVALGLGAWWWLAHPRAKEVKVAAAHELAGNVAGTVLNASGYVTARRQATVSSKVTGKVTEVLVEEGMVVHEGQVLARLDPTSIQRQLELNQAQLASARRSLAETEVRLKQAEVNRKRLHQLAAQGVSSQANLDVADADADSFAAHLAVLREDITVADRAVSVQRQQLEDMVIRAPFDGVAISKDAQPGEMISPVSAGGGFTRTGICTVVDMKSLEIDVDVNESYINRVKPGQKVQAVLDAYPDWTIPARVITTIPAADRQKATVKVRLSFDQLDPRILPDMGVKVAFLADETEKTAGAGGTPRPQVVVPKAALRKEGEQDIVFVVAGDHAERRAVKVGATAGDEVPVIAGLRGGDRVVVEGPPDLKDGDRIAVK